MRHPFRFFGYMLIILVIAVPAVIVRIYRGSGPQPERKIEIEGTGSSSQIVNVAVSNGNVVTMPLEDYVVGVVSAEMPALFQPEALAAQAVVARTFVVKRLGADGNNTISADYRFGQGWMSKSERRKRWGLVGYIKYNRKIAAAVRETKGLVLAYHGDLAEASYHSTSGRYTESAEDVWGKAVPYLVSVKCGYCSLSPRYKGHMKISAVEVAKRLDSGSIPVLSRNNLPSKGVQVMETSSTGRVKRIVINGSVYSGGALREALGLPSTKFTVTEDAGTVVFETEGYGHGVGMCQYGANGLAMKGWKYNEILSYYYPGTELGILKR